jgi:hypothetical protein
MIAVAGLTSNAAAQFVEKLPSVESLMPLLSFSEMARARPSHPLPSNRSAPAHFDSADFASDWLRS